MQKIRVAVIGVGAYGQRHALKYSQSSHAELVAVVDTDAAVAREVAAQTGARADVDYRNILSEVDAVSIVVPAESHYVVARDCLLAGLDVLVEKPITLELSDADHLIALAEQQQRILQVGYVERFKPAVRAMASRIESPRYLSCSRVAPFTNRSAGIDVVRDLMIHDIDLACWLIGRPVIDVESAGCVVVSSQLDIVQARLRFEGGCVADLFASRASETPEHRLRLLHADCYTSIDLINPVHDPAVPLGLDALATEIDDFLHCVRSRRSPLAGGDSGRRTLAIALTIRQSIKADFVPPAVAPMRIAAGLSS